MPATLFKYRGNKSCVMLKKADGTSQLIESIITRNFMLYDATVVNVPLSQLYYNVFGIEFEKSIFF